MSWSFFIHSDYVSRPYNAMWMLEVCKCSDCDAYGWACYVPSWWISWKTGLLSFILVGNEVWWWLHEFLWCSKTQAQLCMGRIRLMRNKKQIAVRKTWSGRIFNSIPLEWYVNLMDEPCTIALFPLLCCCCLVFAKRTTAWIDERLEEPIWKPKAWIDGYIGLWECCCTQSCSARAIFVLCCLCHGLEAKACRCADGTDTKRGGRALES